MESTTTLADTVKRIIHWYEVPSIDRETVILAIEAHMKADEREQKMAVNLQHKPASRKLN